MNCNSSDIIKNTVLTIGLVCITFIGYGQWGAFRLTVETKAALQIGIDSGRFGGIYNIIGKKRSDEYVHGGIQWGRTPNLPPFKYVNGYKDSTYIVSYLQQKDSLFEGTIGGLLPNTKYYVRACLYAGWGGQYTPVYGNVVSFTTGNNFITNNFINTPSQVLCIDTNRNGEIVLDASQATGGIKNEGLSYLWQYQWPGTSSWNTLDTSINLDTIFSIPTGRNTVLIRRVVISGIQRSETPPVRITFIERNDLNGTSLIISTENQTDSTITLLSKPEVDLGGYSMEWRVLNTNIADTFLIDSSSVGNKFLYKNPSKEIWIQSSLRYTGFGINQCPQFFSRKISFSEADGNGNIYPTVEVGKQYWMISNLRAKSFNNGDNLYFPADNNAWKTLNWRPAYGVDSSTAWDSLSLGLLYNQWVILDSTRNICPVGWRVPLLRDWEGLMDSLGGFVNAGKELKLKRDWSLPSNSGNNPFNFNASPTGIKQGTNGLLIKRNSFVSYWTHSDSTKVQYLNLYADSNLARLISKPSNIIEMRSGRPIRCMRSGDGSSVITNNVIFTNDTSPCVSTVFQTLVSIMGKQPSGGLNNSFDFEWEMSKVSPTGPWSEAAGIDSTQNYSEQFGPFSADSTFYFRRKVTSGLQVNYSNVLAIKFNIPDNRDSAVINISQYAGDRDSLVLKASVLGKSNTPYVYWAKSTQSDTSGFTDLIAQGDSILSLVNPLSGTWLQAEAHSKLANGNCHYNYSHGIGFTPKDNNGNIYLYTTIGKLRWMTNNLRATRNDSISLTKITNNGTWGSATSQAYCWYNNDSVSNALNHGALYNINVVTDTASSVCPSGWNIPEISEWNYLVSQAGGVLKAGTNLRSTSGWIPTTGVQLDTGKNKLNYNSLPNGYRVGNGGFFAAINKIVSMWLMPPNVGSTMYAGYTGDVGYPGQPSVNTGINMGNNLMGRSIRCVQSVDGSIVISNNSILTPDTVLCSSGTGGSINLTASSPTGGLNNQYSYLWQYTDSANLSGWKAAPGNNSNANYSATRNSGSIVATVWYRRVAESGHRVNNSEPVSITYIDSTGVRGHVDVVNIAQVIGGSKSMVKLKNNSLPLFGVGLIDWYRSSTSDSSGFKRLNGYKDSVLSIYKPDTNMWYFSTRSYYDTVIRRCVIDSSQIISFTPPDGDSNFYATTKIGQHEWMISNLMTTKNIVGDTLAYLSNSILWRQDSIPGFCYLHDQDSNRFLGTLYNHYAMTDSLCPAGWIVPQAEHWDSLRAFTGGLAAGIYLKSTTGWSGNPQLNTFNFNGRRIGWRNGGNGAFNTAGGYWWGDQKPGISKKYNSRFLTQNSNQLNSNIKGLSGIYPRIGLSIRCVKE